jgi:dolichyl-phosphate beta-glucosyltransferase
LIEWLSGQTLAFFEIIVVDDGSRDGTPEVVGRFAAKHSSIRLLRNPGNRGKGYAVRHGMLDAKGEWILFTDADLSTPIETVSVLYENLRKRRAAIAIGSRALDPKLVGVHQSKLRETSGKFFNVVMRRLTGLEFLDTQCGFKLYQFRAARQVFSRQLLDGFSFDVEDLFIAHARSLRIVEVPVPWRNVEGTKVGIVNGLQSFTDLLRIRWNGSKGKYK